MATISIKDGPDKGRQFKLEHDCSVIGRDLDVAVRLLSRKVSRSHAQILCQDGMYTVEDMGSSNGTYLNNQRVTMRTPLADGDELKIGEFVLQFRSGTVIGETEGQVRERVTASSGNWDLYADHPEHKLQMVLELAQDLSQTIEQGPLLDQLLIHLLKIFQPADRGMVLLYEGERLVVRAQRSRRKGDTDYRYSRTIVRQALLEGAGLLSEDVASDERFANSTSLAETEVRSVICVPLIGRDGRRLGAIQLDTNRPDTPFQGKHLRLLATLGLQVAVVLENAALNAARLREESLRRELAVGRQIQQGFLPTEFTLPPSLDVEIYARVHPAREVAGDLYDFFVLPDGRLAFFVGDVSNQGIPAALFMVAVYTLCRHLAANETSPADTLTKLNNALIGNNPSSMFVTLAHGIYDPRSAEVVLASGGHPVPLLRRADGKVEQISVPAGRPLGNVAGDPGATDTRLTLEHKEALILYSDGFTEAFGPDGKKMFGLDRLSAVLGGPWTNVALEECAEEARKAVERFVGKTEMKDDLTLLLLRRN